MKKHAALYIRVSTESQREEGYSMDVQEERLIAYCTSQGIKSYELYKDGGFTGSNIERPEMQRLIKNVKDDKVSHVIVYKIDRMSRSQKDTLYLIEDIFKKHNVAFVSLNENLDTSSPTGRAMLGIMSAFAQLERETIRERTRMGMKERVRSGLWMGGGKIPFGYDYDKKEGILIPNKDAEIVRQIYDLYLKGYAPQKIAQLTGLKYDKHVVQILTRKSNTGIISYNDEEYDGKHEAIIDNETFEKAMDFMELSSTHKMFESNNLLRGLIYCGKCGAKMCYRNWGKKGSKLVCYSQQNSKPYLIKDANCNNSKEWAEEIEEEVIKDLFRIGVKANSNKQEKIITPLEMLTQQQTTLSNKIMKLYNILGESENDLLLKTIKENEIDLNKISALIIKEKKHNAYSNKLQDNRDRLQNIESDWESMSIKEKQNIISNSIDKIIVTDDDVIIKYKFA